MPETVRDTWVMTRRSMRHIVRSMDTIITVVLMPIALLLLFVFVFGGAMRTQTGTVSYVDFITPGIVIMTVVTGISYAAFRLSTDLQRGIINRFRTMPVAPVSILGGQALSSTLSSLLSSGIVMLTAFVIGFRSHAGIEQWLVVVGLIALFTFATTWLAIFFGLLAKTPEGASAFSYILLLLIFVSTAFVPATSITPVLRGFAQNQPMTPIVETVRSLLTSGDAGGNAGPAVLWSVAILVVSFALALLIYRRKTVVVPN